jgi:uncharacterized protein YodC (DUF2158 family)
MKEQEFKVGSAVALKGLYLEMTISKVISPDVFRCIWFSTNRFIASHEFRKELLEIQNIFDDSSIFSRKLLINEVDRYVFKVGDVVNLKHELNHHMLVNRIVNNLEKNGKNSV